MMIFLVFLFSSVFLRLFMLYSSFSTTHLQKTTAVGDLTPIEFCFMATLLAILLLFAISGCSIICVGSVATNAALSRILGRYVQHQMLILRKVLTKRGVRYTTQKPITDTERHWVLPVEHNYIKSSRRLRFFINALDFRQKIGCFGRDEFSGVPMNNVSPNIDPEAIAKRLPNADNLRNARELPFLQYSRYSILKNPHAAAKRIKSAKKRIGDR
jgi:hypothetical protein